MRTRSQARKHRQQQVQQTSVEPPNLEKPNNNPPIVTMADNRTMAQLLEAPTEGYEDAIVVPEITANNFEIKHGLLNLVQNKQFFGHDKEDPYAYIRYFNKITSTMKFPNVPSTSVKLMLFPFSLEGAARIWLEKEPPQSILTWDDLVSKFINKFFPPSKTTNLRNEITRFQQKFDETFYEAWDRFNDLLRGCPHHGFSELHQIDTFYNSLNSNDQDSLNSAAGGNFLDKMPRECLKIIESKSKVRQSRSKAIVSKVSTSSSTPAVSSDVAELKDMVRALILDKKNQTPAPAPVKAVEQSCVTCGGGHSYQNCPATNGNIYRDNIQEYVSQAAAANFNQGNSGYRPPPMANQIRPPEGVMLLGGKAGISALVKLYYPRLRSNSIRSNNDVNVLRQSPVLNDLKVGKAPEVPFVANDVTYKWGYYLTDGIYPEWVVLMKSISQPGSNDVKRIRYKQAHEAARKDVERAFDALKKKWAIVRTPARSRSLKRITHLMYTCIILHNMIRKEKGKTISPDFYPEEQHREDDPVRSAQDRLRVIREIHDEETHLNLKADLVEHIWHRTNTN
ncbi:reverse transcriptase domain-containing protein [Tanacetum coccineum]|uniref:Reverse transcriptase domain-containing protein n=1 Tax=Tanacetum coccineum TaxID=301880 RepID=A0ABQ4ZNZ9_9ASTR